MKYLACIAAASAIKVNTASDPHLKSYDDRTWLLNHYKGEGADYLGYDGNGAKYPFDYFVPNFGQDSDVGDALTSVAEAESELAHKPDWTADAPAPHPTDYFVPNFGRDKDIIAGEENLKVAEGMYNHTWVWKDKSYEIPPVMPWYNGE